MRVNLYRTAVINIFLLFAFLGIFTVNVAAQNQQELRVVDIKGLTRAIASTSKPAEIVLKFEDIERDALNEAKFELVQADGSSVAVSASVLNDGTVIFKEVGPGTWRLSIDPDDLHPVRIEITQ